jgi:AMMECR1 domain-containing protein
VQIEISVLTPMRLVPDFKRLRVGVDGARLEAQWCRAVLLPQAARPGWNSGDFVRALCRKAGLPMGRPPAGARLFRFQAQVFSSSS